MKFLGPTRFSTIVTQVKQYERSEHISITPVTHLAAGYIDYLIRNGTTAHVAIEKSHDLIFQLFGGLEHATIRPWHADGSNTERPPTTDAVWIHLYLSSLNEMATRYSKAAGVAPDSIITIQTLTALLHADIMADGFFNGVGAEGVRLRVAGIPLTSDTLRRDLAVATSRFVETINNVTRLGLAEVAPFVQSLVTNQTAIFDGSSAGYDENGPSLAGCTVRGQEAYSSLLIYPQGGDIEIECTWKGKGDITSILLQFVDPANNDAIVYQRFENSLLYVQIKTDMLRQSLDERGHPIETFFPFTMTAKNIFDITSVYEDRLVVDQRPCRITGVQTERWIGPHEDFSVKGRSNLGLRRVILSGRGVPDSVKEYSYEQHVTAFDVAHGLPCDKVHFMHLVVQSWSGAQTSEDITVHCDATAPNLVMKKSYYQDSTGSVTVNLAEAQWPLTFHKSYTDLDFLPDLGFTAESQKLPVIRFVVQDTAISPVGVTSELVTVKYRYSMGNAQKFTRDWEVISPDGHGTYELPISYQTLLPKQILEEQPWSAAKHNFIATCRADDEHRVEVCVSDPAGNSRSYEYLFHLDLSAPPVTMRNCRPTGALLGGSLSPPNMAIVYLPDFNLYQADISFNYRTSASSLVPDSEIVLLPHAGLLETSITSVDTRVQSLRHSDYSQEDLKKAHSWYRVGAEYVSGDTPTCRGLYLWWENEPCSKINKSNKYPRSWVQDVDWRSRGTPTEYLHDSQTGQRQPISGHHVIIRPNRGYGLHTTTGDATVQGDQGVLDVSKLHYDVDGNVVILVSQRRGNEGDHSAGVDKLVEEVVTVRTLDMRYRPVQFTVLRSSNELPAPSMVVSDNSCRAMTVLNFSKFTEQPIHSF